MRYLLVMVFALGALVGPNGMLTSPVRAQVARQISGLSCGPHALTYQVTALDATTKGVGIRCVFGTSSTSLPRNESIPVIVWYGEGWWGQITYRHLGLAFAHAGGTDLSGYAADIIGNGATFSGQAPGTITLHAEGGSWPAPTVIRVSGVWSERWVLAQRVSLRPLPQLTQCSKYFPKYVVQYAGHSGTGLRCLFRLGTSIKMWLGNGTVDGNSYTQIGYLSFRGYAASDLCGSSFGIRCQSFPPGSVKLTVRKRMVIAALTTASGTATETWLTSLPPPPMSFSFDQLEVNDLGGHVRRQLKRGQGFIVDAAYTVRNLGNGRVLDGMITRTYYIREKGRFTYAEQNADDFVVARNGTQHQKHRSGAGFQQRTTVRVVTTIKLGTFNQTRQVEVQVR